MPVRLTRLPSGKVRVSTPNQVHAKGTTMKKALIQKRIIEEAEGEKGHAKMAPKSHRKRVHHSPTMTEINHEGMHGVAPHCVVPAGRSGKMTPKDLGY